MGNLAALGFVSGFGKGVAQTAGDLMKYNMQMGLENKRQEMENLRQQRLLEAQRAMNEETIAGHVKTAQIHADTATENARLARGVEYEKIRSNENIAADNRVLDAEKMYQQRKTGQEELASRERIAEKHDAAMLKGEELNRKSREAISAADQNLKRFEINMTAEATTRTSVSKMQTEVGHEITRLSSLLANPGLDPNMGKEITDRIGRLSSLHDRYSTYMATQLDKEGARPADATPAPPSSSQGPVKLGKYGPPEPQSGGLFQQGPGMSSSLADYVRRQTAK